MKSVYQKPYSPTFLGALVILLSSFSLNGYSQDTEAASDAKKTKRTAAIEEVFVTARKRVEPLQETPVAATVLGGQNYQLLFLNDLKTLEMPAPNVTISQIDYFSNAVSVSIRGIVNTDIESSFDPPVGIFVDGVYIPRPAASSLDLFDVEQVEILRGPQGTIFGRNTSAGAVQVRSRRPSGEFGGRASITVGEYGRFDLKAAVDIPIVEGKVDAKVAALSQSMDGYFTSSITGRDLGEEDILSVRPMIRFTPTDDFDLTLIGEYHRNKSKLMPGQNDSTPTDQLCILQKFCGSDNPLGRIDEFRVPQDDSGAGFIDAEIWGITAEMNWDVGPGVITSVSNYRETDEFIDIDGEHLTTDFFQISRDGQHDQHSTELRFASTAWDTFDFIAGVYYFKQEYAQESQLFIDVAKVNTGFTHLVGNANQKHESYSVFAEGNYHFTDQLTLTLGGRWSRDEKEFSNQMFGVFPTPGTLFEPGSKSWDDFGPKVGIKYQWTDDLMTYFNYSRGYKSGGFNGRCQTKFSCDRTFDPESVDGFEVGMKADLFDNKLRANLALFWNDYDDLQRTAIVPLPGVAIGNETVTENAASARIHGVELELSAFPTEGLQIDFSMGYLDASYEDFCVDLDGPKVSATVPTSTCGDVFLTNVAAGGARSYLVEEDLSSVDLQRAPEWTSSVNVNYEFPFRDVGNIVLNTRYSYAHSQFTDQLESSPRSASNLLDASISFVDIGDRYRVSLFGLNLTDDLYVTARNVAGGLWTTRFVNPPRRWGVELSVNF